MDPRFITLVEAGRTERPCTALLTCLCRVAGKGANEWKDLQQYLYGDAGATPLTGMRGK